MTWWCAKIAKLFYILQSPSGNLNLIFLIFFPTTSMQDIAYHATMNLFFRVFLNSNHKISRHKSSRKFPPHLTVVLIEFRSEIYDLKNTLRRRDTNQRPSTTKFRDVRERWAGWAIPHSCFGRSVNPISTRGGRLCPPHYYLPTQLPTSLTHYMWLSTKKFD